MADSTKLDTGHESVGGATPVTLPHSPTTSNNSSSIPRHFEVADISDLKPAFKTDERKSQSMTETSTNARSPNGLRIYETEIMSSTSLVRDVESASTSKFSSATTARQSKSSDLGQPPSQEIVSLLSVDNEPTTERQLIRFQAEEAESLLQSKDFSGAEEVFGDILASDCLSAAEHTYWTQRRAICLWNMKYYQQALDLLEEFLKKNSDFFHPQDRAMYLYLISLNQVCLDNHQSARTNASAALKLFEADATGYDLSGYIRQCFLILRNACSGLGKQVEAKFYTSKLAKLRKSESPSGDVPEQAEEQPEAIVKPLAVETQAQEEKRTTIETEESKSSEAGSLSHSLTKSPTVEVKPRAEKETNNSKTRLSSPSLKDLLAVHKLIQTYSLSCSLDEDNNTYIVEGTDDRILMALWKTLDALSSKEVSNDHEDHESFLDFLLSDNEILTRVSTKICYLGCPALYLAIIYDHEKTLKTLISKGVNLHDYLQKTEDGAREKRDALGLAAMKGSIKSLKLLMAPCHEGGGGRNPNRWIYTTVTRDSACAIPPIYDAISSNKLAVVRELLDHGALLNIRIPIEKYIAPIALPIFMVSDTVTPLLQAVKYGNIKIIQLLLDRGAEVNVATERSHKSPLHIIVTRKNGHANPCEEEVLIKIKIIKMLRAKGAYVTARDIEGHTPYQVLLKRNRESRYPCIEKVRELLTPEGK